MHVVARLFRLAILDCLPWTVIMFVIFRGVRRRIRGGVTKTNKWVINDNITLNRRPRLGVVYKVQCLKEGNGWPRGMGVWTPCQTSRDMFFKFPFRGRGGLTKLVNDFPFLDIELCTWSLTMRPANKFVRNFSRLLFQAWSMIVKYIKPWYCIVAIVASFCYYGYYGYYGYCVATVAM